MSERPEIGPVLSPGVLPGAVSRADREKLSGHRGIILWYTGLSGSGKSTLAGAVTALLHERGLRTYILDGDVVRQGLCGDLDFSPAGRDENIRRVQEVARLFLEAGVVVSAAFISPYRAGRDRLRKMVAPGDYVEVHCKASLEVCERRDVKGLYGRARAGQIPEFTGISAPYEEPLAPELAIETGVVPVEQAARQVLDYLAGRGIVK